MNNFGASSTSAFGYRLYTIPEVLDDPELEGVLRPTLAEVLRQLGVGGESAAAIAEVLWGKGHGGDLLMLEEKLQEMVNTSAPAGGLCAALEGRSLLIARQVKPYVVGDSVADIGCGDGLVALHISAGVRRVILADVHNYLSPKVKFPFYLFSEGQPLPIHEEVDTSLLLTVLHHAQDPVGLLREVRRITRRRAVIIESVFGVEPAGQAHSLVRALGVEKQRKYETFIDWLYNRVFHDGVPVPYNFNTPPRWEGIFRETGWSIRETIDLGVDQPVVPEHHFLFVLDTF